MLVSSVCVYFCMWCVKIHSNKECVSVGLLQCVCKCDNGEMILYG